MKWHPLLMSGPLVVRTLDDENPKTQTRRVITTRGARVVRGPAAEPYHAIVKLPFGMETMACPYGVPGDRLWVREAWALTHYNVEQAGKMFVGRAAEAWNTEHSCVHWGLQLRYRAGPEPTVAAFPVAKWRPSIHMPRWASRLTLEVTDVRVERVQDISEVDAIAEGAQEYAPGCWRAGESLSYDSPVWAFHDLWDSINAKRGFGWEVNPWVWVVGYRRVEP